jgi:uncharacterized repeat protein (TIGR03803 family)
MLSACGALPLSPSKGQDDMQPPIGALVAMPHAQAAGAYSTLYSFGKRFSGGLEPKAPLIDVNGILYGTTFAGGSTACVGGCGIAFNITPSGKETVLHRFGGGRDGANPSASLLAVEGLLYGTTEYGGEEYGFGTVFKISTTGVEKVLYRFGYDHHRFNYNDGANPVASLIDVKGKLYGTTYGNSNDGCFGHGCGTVYSITKRGREKVLSGFVPYTTGLLPAANLINVQGTLYGTTVAGPGASESNSGYGTVFSITRTGSIRVLYSFSPWPSEDGTTPAAGLINVNGTLYGTTASGAAPGYGTAFSITTSGSLTTLHIFGYGPDGGRPVASLLNVRGTLYGTTSIGGAYGKGTVFSMSLSGTEKVLHSFGDGSDGATPLAGLIDVNGTLYGTTSAGGTYGNGAVFALRL